MNKSSAYMKRNALKKDIKKLKNTLSATAYDLGGQAKDAIAEKYEDVKYRTADFQGSVVNYVNDKPFKALSIAVFTGLVLGLAMRRKAKYKYYNNR